MHYIFEYYIIFTGQKISKMSPVQKNFHADDTSDGNARPGLSVTAAARDVFSDGVPSGNELLLMIFPVTVSFQTYPGMGSV